MPSESNSVTTFAMKQSPVSKHRANRVYYYDGTHPEARYMGCMNHRCSRKSLDMTKMIPCKGGCQTFYFCSKKCSHQRHQCGKIKSLRSNIEALEQNADLLLMLHEKKNMGNINKRRHPVIFSYLSSRFKFAVELSKVAKEFQMNYHFDEALSIMQNCLRCCHRHLHDSKELKQWCRHFAVCLLDCGRIEQTLSFTTYMLGQQVSNLVDVDEFWIYPMPTSTALNIEPKSLQKVDFFIFFVLYITRLKQLLSLTLVRQSMICFQGTDCYKTIAGLEGAGPLSLLIEYLLPFHIVQYVSWDNFLSSCEELHANVIQMTTIIYEKNPRIMQQMKMLTLQGEDVQGQKHDKKSASKTEVSRDENEVDMFVTRCKYSILSMPDLEVWLKYAIQKVISNNVK